jgi:hypothetical protein
VAFGAVATLESLARIEQNQPDLNIDLSEMHLFNCGGGSCQFGWYNSSACAYLKNNGTPDEACWPYQPVNLDCSNTCPDWRDRAVKIQSYGSISGITSHMNYVAITPVLVAFDVYTDFFYYAGGIYEHTWGVLEAGHAVSIVGYDTTGPIDYWIVKNSWGPGWGESGFFRIKMGECRIETRESYWMSGAILPDEPGNCVDISYDGFCDGAYLCYDLATGYVYGNETGCASRLITGAVAPKVFGESVPVQLYGVTSDWTPAGVLTYKVRRNNTWENYYHDGVGGIVILFQGTWSLGPPPPGAASSPSTAE